VRDGVLRRTIDKWLAAGVLEGTELSHPDAGTPQGGVVSPLQARRRTMMSGRPSTPNARPEAAAAQLLLQLATGHFLAAALQVVVRLGIADLLAGGPRTAAQLAGETGVQEDALYRVLRALASVGVFEEGSGSPSRCRARYCAPASRAACATWDSSSRRRSPSASTPSGRERTEEEFRALFARAGFELTRVVPTESPLGVIEAQAG
jgi:hypothetical protein